ncbi:MAG: hypothetical protein ACRCT2_16965, partial [Plesiomonas shigelloides]
MVFADAPPLIMYLSLSVITPGLPGVIIFRMREGELRLFFGGAVVGNIRLRANRKHHHLAIR